MQLSCPGMAPFVAWRSRARTNRARFWRKLSAQYSSSDLAERLNAMMASTPCRLGKRPWRPWLEDRDDDDIDKADEGDARKAPKTMIDELVPFESSYERLFFNRGYCDGTDVLLITQKQLHDCPPAGYTSLARLSVDSNAQYNLQVLLHTIESGELESTDQFKQLCDRISDYSKYKFCPGFDYETYMNEYHKKIRYHPSKVQITTHPFKRVQSCKCAMWYKLPKNAPAADKASLTALCGMCKRLRSELDRSLKRCVGYSPRRKVKRQQPSSNYPLKYMSPASLKKRKSNTQQERNKDKRALAKYRHMELTLDDEQNDELVDIMAKVETVGKDTLEEIFTEAETSACGAANTLRCIWEHDKRNTKDIILDQQRNSMCAYILILHRCDVLQVNP